MRVIELKSLKYDTTIEGLVDSVLTTAYPRKCDNCGCGMSYGYVIGDESYSCSSKECEEVLENTIKEVGYKDRDESYEDDFHFYTDWCEDAIQEGDIVYTEKGEELKVELCTTIL